MVEVDKRVIVIQLAEVFGWWLYYKCSWQGGDRVCQVGGGSNIVVMIVLAQ